MPPLPREGRRRESSRNYVCKEVMGQIQVFSNAYARCVVTRCIDRKAVGI